MNTIIEIIKKKLFALEDVLHPYDGGIRMADANEGVRKAPIQRYRLGLSHVPLADLCQPKMR